MKAKEGKMKKFLTSSFLIMLLFLTACSSSESPGPSPEVVTGKQVSVEGGSYMDVSASELQSMLSHKDFTIVNVHIPYEGNIHGTDLSIAYDQITQHLDELPGKDARIVLYCRSGRMSTIAAQALVGLGYSNVWNLSGGMAAWEGAGLKIDQ
jgi:rhodanese-related sulfurtransferase